MLSSVNNFNQRQNNLKYLYIGKKTGCRNSLFRLLKEPFLLKSVHFNIEETNLVFWNSKNWLAKLHSATPQQKAETYCINFCRFNRAFGPFTDAENRFSWRKLALQLYSRCLTFSLFFEFVQCVSTCFVICINIGARALWQRGPGSEECEIYRQPRLHK